jgi:hypothetical protein
MNAIIGGSQERAVYIGDNSEIVLGTNRTEAWTLDAVKELPLGTSLVMGISLATATSPGLTRRSPARTVQTRFNSPGNDDAALRSVMSAFWRRADESKERHHFRL